MLTVEINGKNYEAQQGETILEALNRVGVKVPTLCHLRDLFPTGACRMCVVEVEGQRNLIPSCAYPVADGMKIKTHSPRTLRARKTIVELLLSNHPDDCLFCVRNNNCELQGLANELGVRERRYTGLRNRSKMDLSNPAIVRDPEKCILCGKCVRVCEEVQGVAAIDFAGRGSQARVTTTFEQGLNLSSCVNCGQCVRVCPTGALYEQDAVKDVMEALSDPDKFVVVQHAPAVSVSLGEEFGMKAGADVMGVMTAALRTLGFERVYDTAFSADLTIMEEGSELVRRITEGGKLPMLTSCSPGWIKYVEQFYPDFLDNLSTCKSPQQMLGAVVKSYVAEKEGVDPKNVYSVSVMPCTAKKFESRRPEMGAHGLADIDAVLTTRELAQVIRANGLDMHKLEPEAADLPFGERSSAGKLFGASGGVMEAAIRTAYHLITGAELPELKVQAVRGMKGVKETRVEIDGTEIGVAVVSGLANARRLLEEVRAGRKDLHFIEVMTCPGGCINGGGQPRNADPEAVRARMQALYQIDRDEKIRTSHENPAIRAFYEEYLGEPLGERSHHLLHTHYAARETVT